jgi:hypothetical protein
MGLSVELASQRLSAIVDGLPVQDWRKNETRCRIHGALYGTVRELEVRQARPTAAKINAQSVKISPDAQGDIGFDPRKNSWPAQLLAL